MLQRDRRGALGEQLRRRIGIQVIEHRLDRLHRGVEVGVDLGVDARRAVVLPRLFLGVEGFTDVRIGKRFELTVEGEVTDEVLAEARRIADEVLSNAVIEDVVGIEVVE